MEPMILKGLLMIQLTNRMYSASDTNLISQQTR